MMIFNYEGRKHSFKNYPAHGRPHVCVTAFGYSRHTGSKRLDDPFTGVRHYRQCRAKASALCHSAGIPARAFHAALVTAFVGGHSAFQPFVLNTRRAALCGRNCGGRFFRYAAALYAWLFDKRIFAAEFFAADPESLAFPLAPPHIADISSCAGNSKGRMALLFTAASGLSDNLCRNTFLAFSRNSPVKHLYNLYGSFFCSASSPGAMPCA